MTERRSSVLSRVVAVCALAAAVAALVLSDAFDAEAASAVLVRANAGLLVALLPFALLLVVDAVAWGIALDAAPSVRMLLRLVGARLGVEAVSLTAPGSMLASDGIAPVLFARSADVPGSAAVAGVALKKWGIVLGHAIALALAASLGGQLFARLDGRMALGGSARTILVAVCLLCVAGCALLASVLTRGAAERLRRAAARVPIGWLHRKSTALVEAAAETDAHASRFFRGRLRRKVALVCVSTLVWVAETFEVYVLLLLLGARPSFPAVLAVEAVLSIARSAAFFSPGGLGAQELAYLTVLPPLLGAESAHVVSGFLVLRRGRDLLTVVLGYGTLARRALAGAR